MGAYEAALRGDAPCWIDVEDRSTALPVNRWTGPAGPADERLLTASTPPLGGTVLDVGCGPGRLAAALTGRGIAALGIDVSALAVEMARAQGAAAMRRDVFDQMPGEGHWDRVLLADGNIGIGGDPVALLRRCRTLLAPTGRVIADLDRRSSGVQPVLARLRASLDDGDIGGPLPWARVGADAAGTLAVAADLRVVSVDEHGPAAVVVWERRG